MLLQDWYCGIDRPLSRWRGQTTLHDPELYP